LSSSADRITPESRETQTVRTRQDRLRPNLSAWTRHQQTGLAERHLVAGWLVASLLTVLLDARSPAVLIIAVTLDFGVAMGTTMVGNQTAPYTQAPPSQAGRHRACSGRSATSGPSAHQRSPASCRTEWQPRFRSARRRYPESGKSGRHRSACLPVNKGLAVRIAPRHGQVTEAGSGAEPNPETEAPPTSGNQPISGLPRTAA
jgi:hypothetical protein